jgi:hypothetical protein
LAEVGYRSQCTLLAKSGKNLFKVSLIRGSEDSTRFAVHRDHEVFLALQLSPDLAGMKTQLATRNKLHMYPFRRIIELQKVYTI